MPHEHHDAENPSNTPVVQASTYHDFEGVRQSAFPPNGRLASFRRNLTSYAYEWANAIMPSHEAHPHGYQRPIPFDQVFFSKLDKKISFGLDFELDRRSINFGPAPAIDAELEYTPDHAITHPLANRVIVPHHPLRPWEDIPPYQRSRGYNDQPAYTDDYDDFLWLPRDPLSTLDLDDTVEMRLSLTTSAGGPGTIGDWPHVSDLSTFEDEEWQEIIMREPHGRDQRLSPSGNSERRLIELPETIRSELEDSTESGILRRSTRKASQGLSQVFRRPRAETSEFGAVIPMQTFPNNPHLKPGSSEPPPPMSRSSSLSPVVPSASETNSVPMIETTAISSPPLAATNSSFRSQVGRSPSSHRPSGLRTSSQTTDTGVRSSGHLLDRSASTLSPRRLSSRDRSIGDLTSQQRALLDEVMEEERIASKGAREGEQNDLEKENEEMMKDQERMRRVSNVEGLVGRSASRRAIGMRPGPTRLGSGVGSTRGSVS